MYNYSSTHAQQALTNGQQKWEAGFRVYNFECVMRMRGRRSQFPHNSYIWISEATCPSSNISLFARIRSLRSQFPHNNYIWVSEAACPEAYVHWCNLRSKLAVLYFDSSAKILEQSMGARNRVGTGLSYWLSRLHRLAESIPWNRSLRLKIPSQKRHASLQKYNFVCACAACAHNLPMYSLSQFQERHASLQKYNFVCACPACAHNLPIYILTQFQEQQALNSHKLPLHCKKAYRLSRSSQDGTNQTLPGREKFNYSLPGRVWLVTTRLRTRKFITFFYSGE